MKMHSQKNKDKCIPSIFKDESTGSCIFLWKLAVAVTTYVSICIVYRIQPSFASEIIQFQKMWKLDVALETYVSCYTVYRILPSFAFPLIIFLQKLATYVLICTV
jgi:hypothetical protein